MKEAIDWYVVLYRTRSGQLAAWSDHATRDEALEKARERTSATARPHHVALVVLVVNPTLEVVELND